MKVLICQLCGEKVSNNALFNHLVDEHKWETSTGDISNETASEQKTSKATKKGAKSKNTKLNKSPELLTCPYCSQRFKRKQTLLDHMRKCSHKKTEKLSKLEQVGNTQHSFSYNWGIAQPLDKKYEKTVSTLASEKGIDYLSKEIDTIITALKSSTGNSLMEGRLIIFSKAKQRAMRAEKRKKARQKKNKRLHEKKIDALDRRLPGSFGSGRN